jgi:hypothetical protein
VDSGEIKRSEGLGERKLDALFMQKIDLLSLAQLEEECLLKLRFSSKKIPRSLQDLNFSLG